MTDFTGDQNTLRKKPRYEHVEYPMWVAHPKPGEDPVLCHTREERTLFYKGLTVSGRKELSDKAEAARLKKEEDDKLDLEMATAQREALEAIAEEARTDLEKAKIAADKESSKEMDALKGEAEKAAKPQKSKKEKTEEDLKFS